MKGKDILWSIITLVCWYVFAYAVVYIVKNPVNLWWAALWLLVLGTLGIVTCPWFQHTEAWKELIGARGTGSDSQEESLR